MGEASPQGAKLPFASDRSGGNKTNHGWRHNLAGVLKITEFVGFNPNQRQQHKREPR
jgi:hypothetical protein